MRLVGDGLADRLTNRGFAVPLQSDRRWQDLAEARCAIETAALRLSIERGDLEWEARVRATHHRLARTPAYEPGDAQRVSADWSHAHREFHRALLDGSGNTVLLETFDRMWLAAALARDADTAAALLTRHLTLTAAALENAGSAG